MLNFRVSLRLFSFGNRKGMCRYLEKMAAKGWMPESLTGDGLWMFRRILPTALKYAVFYARPAKEKDAEAMAKQAEFYELCAHDGWELVCTNSEIQIFCNRRPDPVPLDTDPVAELDRFHAAFLRGFVPTWILTFCLFALSIWQEIRYCNWNLHWQERLAALGIYREEAAAPWGLWQAIPWGLFSAALLANIAEYFWWYRRAKKAAQEGIFFSRPGIHWIALALWLAFFVFLFLGNSE
ncbi:MAG TPA: DUF2812 domain-containing protein [Candidatus Faecousia excrementipullorum]|jgi:hypothetical protein|nr:DUF2812 domain-containing protein [Candidatus Faecousia excrementipullorum]